MQRLKIHLYFIFFFQIASQPFTINGQGLTTDQQEFDIYRPKIIEVSYSSLIDYNTVSSSEAFGNARTEFESDNQLKIKLGVPLVLKKEKKFGLQFKYANHRFVLDDDEKSDYALFNHLNTRNFKSLAARFLYERSLGDKKKISLSGGTEIKSDEIVFDKNSTKHFLALNYAVSPTQRTSYGWGVVAGYTLGRFQAYPIFTLEHRFTKRLTMNLKLPKAIDLRYRINDGLYLIGLTSLRGWRYNLHNAIPNGASELTIRRASVEMSLNIEQEVHDWLWVSFKAGLMKNLRYYLVEPGGRRRDAIVDLSAGDMRFVKASLFIVPPRKFYK